MKYGIIYKITNKLNNKIYIGKTVQDFERRCQPHRYKSCRAFNNAIISHGWDNFTKEPFISALDESYLAELEEMTIKHFNSLAPSGYNLIEIDNGLNRYSQEIRSKMSENKKEYYRNKIEPNIAVNKKEHIFIDGVEHKNCYKCNQNKLLVDFCKDKNRWDGLATGCKKCHYKLNQDRKTANKLSPEELKQSYIDRKEAVSNGVKKSFEDNPGLRLQKAKEKSKPIIGTHVETGKQIEFESALAANKYGFSNVRINVAIKKGYVHKNHTWRFK
jgi:group I intron endonuclease